MTDSPQIDELLEAGDIHGLLRACHARDLTSEGIPMVLGLADERGSIPASTDAAALAAGAALRERLEAYHRALVPFSRADDEGALITAMQVLAFAHFDPRGAEEHRPGPVVDAAAPSAG